MFKIKFFTMPSGIGCSQKQQKSNDLQELNLAANVLKILFYLMKIIKEFIYF